MVNETFKNLDHYGWSYQGIPLTEDILVKIGFSKRKVTKGWNGYEMNRLDGLYDIKNGNFNFYWDNDNDITNIHFVHQLQNLYFALTGEELKIEL